MTNNKNCIINWRKPEFICYETEKLFCKIKARANSDVDLICLNTDYAVTALCGNAPENAEGGGDGGDFGPCGIVSQCVEVGPLFGCDEGFYCSSLFHLLR